MEIPVLLIEKDADGEIVLTAGTREVDEKERIEQMNEALANIFIKKIKQENNRKIDQRVLAIEIGFDGNE
ncbi:MAG: hypothetical protein LBT50_03955 [Prevotellaceae bacterium]|jgi:hypothetical protein|nr:hypothetical protein [Prevotellaceae bacterium]